MKRRQHTCNVAHRVKTTNRRSSTANLMTTNARHEIPTQPDLSNMNTRLTTIFTAFLLSLSAASNADNHASDELFFDTGSSIIYCAPTDEADVLPMDTFNEAFQLWIPNLLVHYENGTVARVHFLNQLKNGIFILVRGDSLDEAMENANAINSENLDILKASALETGFELDTDNSGICQILPVGPQLIGPGD